MKPIYRLTLVILFALAFLAFPAGKASAQEPPQVMITQGPPATTYDTFAVFDFTSDTPGTTFDCKLATVGSGGTLTTVSPWSACTSGKTYSNLSYGTTYRFFVKAQAYPESTAVTGEWSINWPAITIDSGPDATTYSRQATFTFHSNPSGVQLECAIAINGVPPTLGWQDCTSPKTYTDLYYNTDYGFVVRPKGILDDSEHYQYYASYSWHIEWVWATIDSGPENSSTSTEVTITFHSNPADAGTVALQCVLLSSADFENPVDWDDPAFLETLAWSACASPKTYTDLTYSL